MKKLNWDYLYHMIRKRSGYSVVDYCTHKLHKTGSYLSGFKRRGSEPNSNVITYMIKDLGLDQNALWQIDEFTEENDPNELTAEEFNELFTEKRPDELPVATDEIVEKDSVDPVWLMNTLEDINTKLDMFLEMEERLVRVEESADRINAALARVEEAVSKPRVSALEKLFKVLAEVQDV